MKVFFTSNRCAILPNKFVQRADLVALRADLEVEKLGEKRRRFQLEPSLSSINEKRSARVEEFYTDDERSIVSIRSDVVIKYNSPFFQSNKAYGKTGKRDAHLEMERCKMGGRVGTLHFIRFPTAEMTAFMALAKSKGIASMATTICATGGGAHLFEEQFREVGKVCNV